ncbi:MAG: DNA primase [Candidatus Faecousia sp.]|nr:DNA primase [Candidatus Faecousia sp.]
MPFPPAFLDELIAKNPIEDVVGQYVRLSKKGGNLFGLCPFHGEKTPSFSVAPGKQIYYCFGCHKGGGVINFIMEIENLSYPDAVRFLAKRAGMEVPEDDAYQSRYRQQERLWKLCRDAARFFHSQLMEPDGAQARAYLAGRGLTGATVTRFGLGFAPDAWSSLTDRMLHMGYTRQELVDAGLAVQKEKNGKRSVYDKFRNRVMFPIIDLRGNVIGFGGRVMDGSTPKYLNSPETVIFNKRKNLFALNVAKKSKQGYIILCEGYMDTITLHQYGFDCAVASLGTALTDEQVNLLSKYTQQVVLTYDSDAAGQDATRRAIPMLERAGLQVKILRMQGAKDPDEYLKKYGADRFAVLLQKSENQAEYQLLSLQNRYNLTQDEQKVEFLRQAAELICSFSSAVEREIYGARAAEAAGITPQAMKIEVDKAYRRRMARRRRQQERKNLSPAMTQQPGVKGIRYDNVRSAMAEEGILRLVLLEPELLEQVGSLTGAEFSSPLLGRAFDELRARYGEGLSVSLAVLEDFSPEELTHLSAVVQKEEALVNDAAFRDYLQTVHEEYLKTQSSGSDEDMMALRDRLLGKKGYGG